MEFNKFINIHTDKTAIICGCGQSLNLIKDRVDILNNENIITIGVNDVAKLFTPTYTVVVDSPNRFTNNRNLLITKSSSYIFTQIVDWKIESGKKVLFKLGLKSKLENLYDKNNIIDYSNNSPYMACIIAYKMGCHTIALIGVDFTLNHFYAEDGEHNLIKANRLNEINNDYINLYNAFKIKNVNLYNLSENSKVLGIPKLNINEILKIHTNNESNN